MGAALGTALLLPDAGVLLVFAGLGFWLAPDSSVRQAFKDRGVEVLVADWTHNDPAITRILDDRGRAAIPLYLWYAPGRSEPEELPQVLTPSTSGARAACSRPSGSLIP